MSPNPDPTPNSGSKNTVAAALRQLLQSDSYLKPFEKTIAHRLLKIETTAKRLTGEKIKLADFASGHEYFGLHFRDSQWAVSYTHLTLPTILLV